MEQAGSLVCVGLGITLGAHLSPRSRSHIEQADVVFAAVSDPVVELWLKQMHPDVRSLQALYSDDKSRQQTYREMVETLLVEVRAGRRVCGAFYGHPGVFAQAPHAAIARARSEGFVAHMEPGISAADCLYADLGIDPGEYGCQHYEASQFMFFRRQIDTSAYLILWQVGVAGDRSYQRFVSSAGHAGVLQSLLLNHYPADHQVILYEAATLPILAPRRQVITLGELSAAALNLQTTLVIPPCQPLQRNIEVLNQIAQLDAAQTSSSCQGAGQLSKTAGSAA